MRFMGSVEPYIDVIASMEDHMVGLPYLRTVTLETKREYQRRSELVERLDTHYRSGRLRLRTCAVAQRIVQSAQRDLANLDHESVLSPLWYSRQYSNSVRERWYATLLLYTQSTDKEQIDLRIGCVVKMQVLQYNKDGSATTIGKHLDT